MEAGLNNFSREVAQHVVIRRPCKGHDPAVIGRNGRLIEADVRKIGAELAMAVERFILLQEADAVLCDKDPARFRQRLQPS